MKIVIDIPDILYKKIQMGLVSGEVCECINNGTVLPKGHGRLIDIDALKTFCKTHELMIDDDMPVVFLGNYRGGSCKVEDLFSEEYAPTIIEADKEADNEQTTD